MTGLVSRAAANLGLTGPQVQQVDQAVREGLGLHRNGRSR